MHLFKQVPKLFENQLALMSGTPNCMNYYSIFHVVFLDVQILKQQANV